MQSTLLVLVAASLISASGPIVPTTGPVVGEGKHCGGFMQHPPTCKKGLFCNINLTLPDAGGVCVSETAKKGEKCGVFSTNVLDRRSCGKGLTCKLTNANIPDLGGVCIANGVGLGHKCLVVSYGKTGADCKTGLTCRLKNKHKPKLGGVCVRATKKYQ